MTNSKGQESDNNALPSEPFFPPLATAKRAIPLTDRAGKLASFDYEPGLSIDCQLERLLVSSRVGYIIFQMQGLETADSEFFQTLVADTEVCQICCNESRPNHLLKARIRKEWLIYKSISEETANRLEHLLALAGQKVSRRFYLEAEIIENLQSVLSSDDKSDSLSKALSKGKASARSLRELNELMEIGILEGDQLFWERA